VGVLRRLQRSPEEWRLAQSAIYRYDEGCIFYAENLRTLTGFPFSPEAATVGEGVCLLWQHDIQQRVASIGRDCRLVVIHYAQPSRVILKAREGIVQMSVEASGDVLVRFQGNFCVEQDVPLPDPPPPPVVPYEGGVRFAQGIRPADEMPLGLGRLFEELLSEGTGQQQ